jgi:hypothetical protein
MKDFQSEIRPDIKDNFEMYISREWTLLWISTFIFDKKSGDVIQDSY